jgi:hypothetical protein
MKPEEYVNKIFKHMQSNRLERMPISKIKEVAGGPPGAKLAKVIRDDPRKIFSLTGTN